MKVKDLIEKLQEYPEDMEVVLLGGYDSYEPSIVLEKVTATIYPEDINEKDDFMKSYFHRDSDDYWSFRRVDVDVIILC
jgi:hypothetical protein